MSLNTLVSADRKLITFIILLVFCCKEHKNKEISEHCESSETRLLMFVAIGKSFLEEKKITGKRTGF